MYFTPTAEVDLGMGMHEATAQLNTSEHCALPVSATVMVGEGESHDGHETEAEHDDEAEDKHDHEDGGEDISLGALEIRPR